MKIKIGQSTLGEMLPAFIIITVLLLFLIFCIKTLISTSKVRSKVKKEGRIKLQALKDNGMTYSIFATHTSGLPIPENMPCTIRSYPDRYEITASGSQFNLNKEKVNNICLNTDVEIQKQYVSSAGSAVGGAALFGPLGAMIGGRVKEKKDRIVHTYLIFAYTKDNAIDYIGFDATNDLKAGKLVDEFKNMNLVKAKVVTDL